MNAVGLPGCQEGDAASVPADWVVLKIGEMTEVSAGGTPATGNKSYWFPPEVPWMSSGEVHKRRIFTTEKKISTLGLTNSAAKVFPKRSVVMALAGQGKTRGCVAVLEAEVATNQSLAAIYPSKAFDTDFLFHNLDWRYKELRSLSSGEGGRGGLNLSIIKSVPIGLPPLPEQRKIAAILTAVDDKLDVIARQIKATKTLKQGLMQTLFSRGVGTQDADARWVPHAEFKDSELGEIPAAWEVATLNQCSKVIYRYPGFYGFEPLESGIPVVRGEHIKNGRLSTDWGNYWYVTEDDSKKFPKTVLEKGDLVMAVRGTVGNFGVVGPEHVGAQISPNLIRISPNEKLVDSSFFYFQMDSSARALQKSYVQSQALPSLSASDIKGIPMPLPPIREQEKIGEVLSAVDKKLRHLLDRKSLNEVLKRGLMQKLLTGEWRVSVDASAAGT